MNLGPDWLKTEKSVAKSSRGRLNIRKAMGHDGDDDHTVVFVKNHTSVIIPNVILTSIQGILKDSGHYW